MISISKCRPLRIGVLTAGLLYLGGCATITRSPDTQWSVSSFPAGAEVKTSNGGYCDMTPCSVLVARKQTFAATLSLPGYKPETVQVQPTVTFDGGLAFVGNALIGGLFGASLDLWTGAALDPTPSGKLVTLVRDPSFDDTACTSDKVMYAFEIGVPCASLRTRFDPRPQLAANTVKPAPKAAKRQAASLDGAPSTAKN